jgi:predicted nucleic acid-binding protein
MLLLDSEAISSLAHGTAARRDRIRALIAAMRAKELSIAAVAAGLAEVVRGRPADAGVFAGLKRERVHVHAVDVRVAIRAGQLLGRVRAGSELAVDAFTVAAGDLAGGAMVATTDPDALDRLAAHAAHVRVVDIT